MSLEHYHNLKASFMLVSGLRGSLQRSVGGSPSLFQVSGFLHWHTHFEAIWNFVAHSGRLAGKGVQGLAGFI